MPNVTINRRIVADNQEFPEFSFGRVIQLIDGTIVGNEFIDKSGNGYNLDITGKDFDITSGFPYKSNATIAQKAANFGIIPDVNNFWFDSGGAPNQIPVVSLFQNIQYANIIFCKHQVQSLNPSGAENLQPFVSRIVTYSSALSGSSLIFANSYFEVPSEVTSNAKWIDPVNGNNANPGTKASPYQTFATAISNITTGGTIYMKNGDLAANITTALKGFSFIGTGFCKNTVAGTGVYPSNTANSDTVSVKGIIVTCVGGIGIRFDTINGGFTVSNCKITASTSVYSSVTNTSQNLLKYNIISGQVFLDCTTLSLDTNYISQNTAAPIRISRNIASSNNRYIGTSALGLVQYNNNTTSMSFLGDKINGNIIIDANVATGTVTINYCRITPNSTGTFLSIINNSTGMDYVITNNYINQTYFTASTLISLKAKNIVFSGNTINGHNGYVMDVTGISSGRTITVSDNYLNHAYNGTFAIKDYSASIYNNIFVSDNGNTIHLQSVNYSSLLCNIYGNHMENKGDKNFIVIGTEYSVLLDGRFDGTNVYGNTFLGPIYFGNSSTVAHALFTWSNQINWYNNFIYGCNLGIVNKSNGGTFATKAHHNVIVNCSGALLTKGMKGCEFVNNTVYNDDSKRVDYCFLGMAETVVPGDSGNTVVKNNIFYDLNTTITSSTALMSFENSTQETGSDVNYNVSYRPYNPNYIGNVGASYYSFLSWQGIGYDANGSYQSIVFQNTAENVYIPTAALYFSENLGATYINSLDENTDFKLNEEDYPVISTKPQGYAWQNGAYIKT